MLETSSWNVTPTTFQQSTFPSSYHGRISVVHDGIDTSLASPAKDLVQPLTLPDKTELTSSQKIVTFVNRTIEPYRGCLPFIRAIPSILQDSPEAHLPSHRCL